MAIPASHIVNVIPRVIPGGSADLELNGLLISDNALISADAMVLEFSTAASVGAYFGLDSVEYAAADVYFTSFDKKQTAPRSFFVARRLTQDAKPWLRGAKFTGTLAELQAVTDGSCAFSINNICVSFANVNFSAASSFSEVAAILQTSINMSPEHAVDVTWSSLTGAFMITGRNAGSRYQIDYAASPNGGTDMAALLQLRQEDGAVVSQGCDALSVNEQMAAIRAKTENWVSFTTAWEVDAAEALEWGAWANKHYGWLYVAYTTRAATLPQDPSNDPASALQNAGYEHTTAVYGTLEYASFIMGVVASIAWRRVNGTITAAFKKQSGLAPVVTDKGSADALERKNCNYFGNFATRNAEFIFLYPGCMSASAYGYIDPYVNSVWLNNRLQVALMDGLSSSGRVPYNQRGYTMIRAWMQDPVREAQNNGVIEPGVVLSERQKSELMNEAGLDISGELWTHGYYIQILDPGAPVRARRESPVISLWYTYGGAVQKIEVASTAVL